MNNKTIAIDIDDVLCDTTWSVLKFYNGEINWVKIKYEEFNSIWFNKIPKLKVKDTKKAIEIRDRFFFSSKEFWRIKPTIGSISKINQRKKLDYKIFFVTWRCEQLKYQTIEWIDKHFKLVYEDIIFANHGTNSSIKKVDIFKNIWANYAIDDSLFNLEQNDKIWIKSFLLSKPWNKQFDPKIYKWITKVENWKEIII